MTNEERSSELFLLGCILGVLDKVSLEIKSAIKQFEACKHHIEIPESLNETKESSHDHP